MQQTFFKRRVTKTISNLVKVQKLHLSFTNIEKKTVLAKLVPENYLLFLVNIATFYTQPLQLSDNTSLIMPPYVPNEHR